MCDGVVLFGITFSTTSSSSAAAATAIEVVETTFHRATIYHLIGKDQVDIAKPGMEGDVDRGGVVLWNKVLCYCGMEGHVVV